MLVIMIFMGVCHFNCCPGLWNWEVGMDECSCLFPLRMSLVLD